MNARGFTLTELLTVMAIVAFVAAFAGPGMGSFIEGMRLTTTTNNIVEALTLARSEAIKRHANVSVQPTDGSNWKNGWAVYDIDDNELSAFEAPSSAIEISASDALAAVTFASNGNRVGGKSVTISVCASSGKGRRIALSALGSTSVERLESGC